ncbi:MAG: cytochrome c [Salibaculum sp.]|uniref:cytochrome c n=1 Tax=Salibaculum sp. TaxID=2855480 RepID=UPI00286FD648|nr:cytochrome c [Salibaculum sp.]MDR9427379.1 cytochrome c [Salibaculum sp.]MDR9482459.1 cytochrome c [Salibaculum sp.]
MVARLASWAAALAVAGGAVGWWLTAPAPLPADHLDGVTGDAAAGEAVFIAAGCASCHTAPGAEDDDGPPVLAGGQRFETGFGTFVAPNISTDPDHGIGGWSDRELANAIQRGISPEGAHYYPAFPYAAYARAETEDIADLIAYMRTLPADATPSPDHKVGFPVNIRRSLGGWKRLFAKDDWVVTGDLDSRVSRGRYLVEALGHCAECHTPRNALGGLDRANWLAGADNPDGDGRIPDITPEGLGWSAPDIAAYLESGFTPAFDTAGGSMVAVIENTSRLPAEDREAIAAYLVALP